MLTFVDATLLPFALVAALGAIDPGAPPASESPRPLPSASAATSTAPAIDWTHAPPPKGWYVERERSNGTGPDNPFGMNTDAPSAGEYERYSHSEPDGRLSIIIARHSRCTEACDPVALSSLLAAVLHHRFHVVTTSVGPMCGAAAARVTAEGGPPLPGFTRNAETTFFRLGDELVTFSYYYTAAAPREGVDAALASLCPTAPN